MRVLYMNAMPQKKLLIIMYIPILQVEKKNNNYLNYLILSYLTCEIIVI